MTQPRRVPLAWHNLTHQPRRFALALAGIGFAVLLMCMQLGFQNALFDSTVALIRQFDADLVICGSAHYTLVARETFPRQRLAEAAGCPGVARVIPIYIDSARALWKGPRSEMPQPIRAIAFDPSEHPLRSPEARALAAAMDRPDVVVFDSLSKPKFGGATAGMQAELAGRGVEVAGLFQLGTDFAYDGNILLSERNFDRLFSTPAGSALDDVNLALVRLSPDADRDATLAALESSLPIDARVLTIAEFEELELDFWRRGTPIGYIFKLGAAMGFLVGVIICYQILYADIHDHLAEFATLKAMGYPARYFVGVVLQQSLWLTLLGFAPGVCVSAGLYAWLAGRTGLPLDLTWRLALLVLCLTAGMCVVSGCLALRKLLTGDPAELFR